VGGLLINAFQGIEVARGDGGRIGHLGEIERVGGFGRMAPNTESMAQFVTSSGEGIF